MRKMKRNNVWTRSGKRKKKGNHLWRVDWFDCGKRSVNQWSQAWSSRWHRRRTCWLQGCLRGVLAESVQLLAPWSRRKRYAISATWYTIWRACSRATLSTGCKCLMADSFCIGRSIARHIFFYLIILWIRFNEWYFEKIYLHAQPNINK